MSARATAYSIYEEYTNLKYSLINSYSPNSLWITTKSGPKFPVHPKAEGGSLHQKQPENLYKLSHY